MNASPDRRSQSRWHDFVAWDQDLIMDGRYTDPRGWALRLNPLRLYIIYRHIGNAGHRPLFSERHGQDRALAVRVGPHLWTFRRLR